MAKQLTNSETSQVPPLLEWPGHWYDQHSKTPWQVWVSNIELDESTDSIIKAPLEAGHPLAIRILQNEPGQSMDGYMLPLCLVQENLTKQATFRLTTALSIMQQMQGLDYTNGLCFMAQVFLMFQDWKRAQRGQGSLLPGPMQLVKEGEDEGLSEEETEHRLMNYYVTFLNSPMYQLDSVLDFWNTGRASEPVQGSLKG